MKDSRGKGVRTRHRWTEEEELVLREGVQLHASSKWSIIQENIRLRTGSDLSTKQVGTIRIHFKILATAWNRMIKIDWNESRLTLPQLQDHWNDIMKKDKNKTATGFLCND